MKKIIARHSRDMFLHFFQHLSTDASKVRSSPSLRNGLRLLWILAHRDRSVSTMEMEGAQTRQEPSKADRDTTSQHFGFALLPFTTCDTLFRQLYYHCGYKFTYAACLSPSRPLQHSLNYVDSSQQSVSQHGRDNGRPLAIVLYEPRSRR